MLTLTCSSLWNSANESTHTSTMTEEEFELLWQRMQTMNADDKAAFIEEIDERNRQAEAMAEMLMEELFVDDGLVMVK